MQYTLLDDYLREEGIDPKTVQPNSHFFVLKNRGKKNKGRKHRERGNTYKQLQEKKIESREEYIVYVKERLGELLIKETLGHDYFNNKTKKGEKTFGYFYIKCPYHKEGNASMTISKAIIGLCKCFGCGLTISFNRMGRETKYQPYDNRTNNKLFDNLSTYSPSEDDDLPF